MVVPPADWRVALFLVAGAIVSTLFFALAPALQATRVELVRAIRGEVVRDGPPGRARDALVALQVTGAVLLLICAAVFLRSSWEAATVDLGIRMAGVLEVRVLNEQKRGGHSRSDQDRAVDRLGCGVVAERWLGGRAALRRGRDVASRLSRTNSSRRSTLAFTTSISYAGAASRRASAAQASRWR